jgi:hypothetical protein
LQIHASMQGCISMRSGRVALDLRSAAITSDNALTFARHSHDTSIFESEESKTILIAAASRHNLAGQVIPAVLAFCTASMGSLGNRMKSGLCAS